ncbi:MAG TPA: S8 family peptidase, partial [Pyrinomonadaceae bacterium]|nr:S8 family peptidase [Pyrinomonadaceae bacterium]
MLCAPRPSSIALRRFTCVALSYVLLVTLSAPLTRSAAKAASPASPPANQSGEFGGHRPGELLIRFRPEVSEVEKDAIVAARGARRGRHLRGGSRFERLEPTGGQTPQMLAQQLADQSSVEWVEPNYLIRRTDITPNDARFGEQWALSNGRGQSGAGIAAPLAWGRTTGSTGTVIAVIDSGVDFTHPDLAGNQWTNRGERANDRDDDHDGYTDDLNGWDWVVGGNRIRDEQGHGTSVAGIIAAEGNNAIGTTGVMWRAGLMSLRVLDNTGTGDVADAVEAIDYAVAHGAQVINLSWGLETQSQALRDAIERASLRGVLVVCSAGNQGRNLDNAPYYPASYDLSNIISVAATESGDNLTAWSNWGATRVTLAAPGVDILTTGLGHDYRMVTGTSAAAPLVSGIAGLVKTSYPRLSAADTRAAIVRGVRQVAGLGGKVLAGGVAQADGALTAAGSMGNGTRPGGGSGNGNGNGGNGGGGNGQGQRQSPAPPRPGSDGRGAGGNFNVTPPEVTRGAPPNLPNLDEARKLKNANPKAPQPSSNISANLMCVDCDPEGGGGGGGYVPPGDPRYSKARTELRNETGQEGVDLGSRNFNWSTPLVGLKGRAGLDFGLALSYNSLVWTKQDYGIKFNADRGFPGPGFRLGFPGIQQRYYNSETGVHSYMMVTPSGGRIELRQVGASNVYEAQDGSYTQMIDNGNGTALVRTTDGTQLSFGTINGEMRCSQIKDRNGNYITVNYDGNGHVDAVVDTLGRIIDFNYDGDGLRVKKVENGVTTYSLRSTVLGSRVVAELQYWNGGWGWTRGYV